MAFGRSKKNQTETDMIDEQSKPTKGKPTKGKTDRKTTAMKVFSAIKEGPKTTEELMAIIGAESKIAMYGIIAYLNTRGLNARDVFIDEGQEELAASIRNFPVKGASGAYELCTFDEWTASKTASKPKKPAKTYTVEQMLANAQKRMDKTQKANMAAAVKRDANPGDEIYGMKASIAELNHMLSVALYNAVAEGNYDYEKGSVAGQED